MIVQELLERLRQCNPEAEVVLAWDSSELEALGKVTPGVAIACDGVTLDMWITPEEAGDMVVLGCPRDKADSDWPSVALWPERRR